MGKNCRPVHLIMINCPTILCAFYLAFIVDLRWKNLSHHSIPNNFRGSFGKLDTETGEHKSRAIFLLPDLRNRCIEGWILSDFHFKFKTPIFYF